MIGFGESFLVWVAATVVPALIGLIIIVWAGTRTRPIYAAAFGLGIFLWFFLDTIGGAASLGVSSGFSGDPAQLAFVGLFIAGLLLFFWTDADRSIFNAELAAGKFGLAIPLLVAIAVGIHGLGEGSAFGTNVATTSSTSLLEAFGPGTQGLYAGIAYALHKALEPMMIGACYSVYSTGRSDNVQHRLKDILSLGAVFAIPSLVGAATGYFVAFNTSYFFALGTGTSIYAAIRLAAPLFSPSHNPNPRDSSKLAISLLLGFMAIYIAALFHA
jgi:hypothetical protein